VAGEIFHVVRIEKVTDVFHLVEEKRFAKTHHLPIQQQIAAGQVIEVQVYFPIAVRHLRLSTNQYAS
jgi:hypothetical protein